MGVRLTWGIGLLALAWASAGCRDFVTAAGNRIIDDHVLAGRPEPSLTNSELAAGRFVSEDAFVAPLERDLRLVGARFGVKSTMWPSAAGTVERFDPTDPMMFDSGPQSAVFRRLEPFITPMNVAELEAELDALCSHPLLEDRIPDSACQGFGLESLNNLPFDDYVMTLDSRRVEVFWDGPRTIVKRFSSSDDAGDCSFNDEGELRSNCGGGFSCPVDTEGAATAGACLWNHPCSSNDECRDVDFIASGTCDVSAGSCTAFNDFDSKASDVDREAPVLVVRAPFSGNFDPNDLLGGLIQVNIPELVFDIRFQPVACVSGDCRTTGLRLFESFRSAAPQDVVESTTGMDVYVKSALVGRSVSISPGPLCFLPIPIPPEAIALFPPLGAAGGGPVPIAACITAGEILRGLVNDSLDDVGTTPGRILDGFMNIPNLSLSLPGFGGLDMSTIQAGDALRPLGGPNGEWTTDTMRLLTTGGGLMRTTLDLSTLNPTCRGCPTNGSPACLACNTMCGGAAGLPTCDLTNAGICLAAPDGTRGHCQPRDLFLDRLTFDTALDLLVTPAPSRQEKTDLWNMLTTPFPASPLAAEVFDPALGIGVALQRLFTQPLDAVDALGTYRFTDTYWCGPGGPRAASCRSGESGAVFRFLADGDRDGTPDELDNCPDVASFDLTDTDGDGFGDPCDTCLWTPDRFNNPRNCQCDIDGDGCVNPLGLPPIADAPPEVPRMCVPGPGEVFDARPTRRTGQSDQDNDHILDDCDPDNDGDDVPDEDDNCPFDENRDQADQNNNGIGDACDLCSAGQPICFLDPNDAFFDPNAARFDAGFRFDFGCVADGPGCFGFTINRCLAAGPNGGCSDFGIAVNLDPSISQLGSVELSLGQFSAGQFGGDVLSASLLPVLSQNGNLQLLFSAAAGDGAVLSMVEIDPVSGEAREVFSYLDATGGFGSTLAFDAQLGLIVAGAPKFEQGPGQYEPFDPLMTSQPSSNFAAGQDPDQPSEPQQDPAGALFVFDLSGKLQQMIVGEPGEQLGTTLRPISKGRILVGAPGHRKQGAIHLFRLKDGKRLRTLTGFEVKAPLGSGPMVAQGRTLFLGAPDARQGNGAVIVASLAPKGFHLMRRLVVNRHALGPGVGKSPLRFGASISGAGDFFGTGRPQLAIGAPGAFDGDGTFLLYERKSGALRPSGIVGYQGARLGTTLAMVGDQNGDGFDDLAVGLPGASPGGAENAHAVLFGAQRGEPMPKPIHFVDLLQQWFKKLLKLLG